ncbi:MAG TPA: Asp-tRNA(Asn)/Glu-tRNA(Gln) amidotransferase subunit GatA, partial [bacterium]|nr:Asp-tRNA(Asn)/Glu-tRNA(Gln) amidotransferase subunit GatA [bacterium]
MDAGKATLWQLRQLLDSREISSVELLSFFLQAISQHDGTLHAYLHVNERALEEAKLADEKCSRGEPSAPLTGIPVAVKDNICTLEQPTTCASLILKDFVSPYEATVVARLRRAGAIILGKTNLDEFAFGSSTENSAFGPTRNPHDVQRVPGGSSGGSAAAVAAGFCPAALGSDTGGSIRQPAAFCGVVGLKPTYGRVSRFGLVAFASSLDQIGPITRGVRDAALIFSIIAGHDRYDTTSVTEPVPDYSRFEYPADLTGLRFGLPREYLSGEVAGPVKDALSRVSRLIEGLGATVEEVTLPHTSAGIAVYYIIATAEASANLARFDGIKYGYRSRHHRNLRELYMFTRGEGFGQEVKRRIILGTFVLSSGYYEAYYLKAQRVRTLIRNDFLEAFQKVHLLLTPTTPELPFLLGEKSKDPLKMYLSDIFTVNANLAGLPAISFPVGKSTEGLPIGLQII